MKKISSTKVFSLLSFIFITIILLSAVLAAGISMASAKDFLPIPPKYTTNFYTAYGEPDIYYSVLGDTEFSRGDTGEIRIMLSNRGVLYGATVDTGVGTSESKQALAMKELEYESKRTTALGVKATLVSNSKYISVDPTTSSQTLDEIVPGQLPDNPLVFTVTISENAPAGMYQVELPIIYEYQNDVRMTMGNAVIVGEPNLDHEAYYTTVNKTLSIPLIIKPAPRFIITGITGDVVAGGKGTINVTYMNSGELPATDAVARIIAMKPLSAENSMQSLGTLEPGESITASFVIDADHTAVEKKYGLDSEVKYIDDKKKISYSSNMKADVQIKSQETKFNITTIAIAAIVITLIVLIFKNILKNMSNDNNRGI